MPVLGNETVPPRRDAPQTGRAHDAGDRAVKRVALQAQEFGERFVSAKENAAGGEIDLRARLLSSQAEALKISQLPRGNINGHSRTLLKMLRHGGAESAVAVKDEGGTCRERGHAASQPRASDDGADVGVQSTLGA